MDKYFKELESYKSIPYSKAFQEPLYLYFQSENYSIKSLKDLGTRLKIKYTILKTYIYSYAKKYLGMNKEEFDKYRKEEIDKNSSLFINRINVVLEKHGIITKFLWTNEEEKELFLKDISEYSKENRYSKVSTNTMADDLGISSERYLSLLKEYLKIDKIVPIEHSKEETKIEEVKEEKKTVKKNDDLYIGKTNVILEKHGIITKYLWRHDSEKEIFLKDILEYSKRNNFSLQSSKNMSEELGISQDRYLDLIRNYMESKENKTNTLNKSNILVGDRVRINNVRLRSIYKKIIDAGDLSKKENLEKLDKIIIESGYNVSHLKDNFSLYEKFYEEDEIKKFYDNYLAYRTYRTECLKEKRIELKKEKEKEKLRTKLDMANSVITSYLNTENITFIEFLNENKITEDEFKEFVNSIKQNNKELYAEYILQKEKTENRFNETLKLQLKELGYRLTNDYEENGVIRKFDIIDYFSITQIPLALILSQAAKVLNKSEMYKLKKLRSSYIHADKYSSTEEKAILEEKRIIGTQFDKNGKLIEGSGREITLDEKENILEFLSKNNIAINRMTYNAALKRYINGFIKFNNMELVLKPNKNS